MVRTQIQLTVDQHRRLRRWAQAQGISLAEAVRRCVSDRLSAVEDRSSHRERVREALAVCGKYRDPDEETTVAEDHDRYLVEAYRQ